MVDAFGREQEFNTSAQADANRSRKALRVVDAMGREIRETDDTTVQESKIVEPSSRAELLSRIRQGLDDLVVDLEDVDECVRIPLIFSQILTLHCSDDEASTADRNRMAELNTISMQARRNRERLHSREQPIDLDASKHQNSLVSHSHYSSSYSD
jgi:hypothetical protein